MATPRREHLIIRLCLHFRQSNKAVRLHTVWFYHFTVHLIDICLFIEWTAVSLCADLQFSFCWLILLAEWLDTHSDILWLLWLHVNNAKTENTYTVKKVLEKQNQF